ncbi:ly6/PLAUR domain-containing protein 5-like [Eleutherodactylus coqui]|uniref:ly6/PLAUR domain-containing protein 5-like n=1 Tax=Eleutherodactylus coqui TaxID=57060 RepID=UPI00346328D6
MASNINPFLGFIVSCLLMTGGLCLDCLSCNEPEVECMDSKNVTCKDDENICSAVLFSVDIGNKEMSKIVKGCGSGSPKISFSFPTAHGIQIFSTWRSCSSEMCNKDVINPSKELPDISTSGVQCWSCLSTEKSKCKPEIVNCTAGHTTCYEASGNLTIGSTSFSTLYVKQCSDLSNFPTIKMNGKWYSISLNAMYCTGNLCNQDPTSTTVFTHSTVIIPVNTTQTSSIETTPSGIGRTQPCYVAMVILVVMASFL